MTTPRDSMTVLEWGPAHLRDDHDDSGAQFPERPDDN